MMEQIKHEKVIGKKMKNYYFCNQLGRGASACVYEAYCDSKKEPVAIKAIPKSYLNSDKKTMELVKTEITILKTCNNDNVIKCFDVFQSPNSIFIVTQFCNDNDMSKYLANKKFLAEDHAVMYLKQILNGFRGLHQISVMHRDFKLANILLHDRVCKIADLGFAKKMDQQELTSTLLGTGLTMAPEVMKGQPYGFKADIWSIGVVFYQLLTGKYPFNGANFRDLLRKIETTQPDYSIMNISPLAKDFIQKCMTVNPEERINWIEVYDHPILHKKQIQLLYGITNITLQLDKNRQYYERNSESISECQIDSFIESGDFSHLGLLHNSYRKQFIIEDIKQITDNRSEYESMLRTSKAVIQSNEILLKYAKNYVMYLNNLICPLKFLRTQLAQKIKEVPYVDTLYLVYKKAFTEAKQFRYVISKKINIFKIEVAWKQFISCDFYSLAYGVINEQYKKCERIFEKIQKQATKSKNKVIVEETSSKSLVKKPFNEFINKQINLYAKGLKNLLEKCEQKNIDLIELCEGILFYLDRGRSKVRPQQFDRYLSKPMLTYKDARKQLLLKFKDVLPDTQIDKE